MTEVNEIGDARVKGKAKVPTGDPQTTSDRPLDRIESENLPIGARGGLIGGLYIRRRVR